MYVVLHIPTGELVCRYYILDDYDSTTYKSVFTVKDHEPSVSTTLRPMTFLLDPGKTYCICNIARDFGEPISHFEVIDLDQVSNFTHPN